MKRALLRVKCCNDSFYGSVAQYLQANKTLYGHHVLPVDKLHVLAARCPVTVAEIREIEGIGQFRSVDFPPIPRPLFAYQPVSCLRSLARI